MRYPGSDFDDYQYRANETALYPSRGNLLGLVYTALGTAGEAGEFAEKVKKLIRDKDGHVDEEFREAAKKELGDVLWYVSQAAWELGLTLDEVAQANLEKLSSRKDRGKLQGGGDDR